MGFLKSWIPVFLSALLQIGCANEKEKKEAVPDVEFLSGLNKFPVLSEGDSVQVLFYKKPYTDRVRYTRFFTAYATSDSFFIIALKQQLDQPFIIKDIRDTCLSDGRFFLLKKGEPLKTFYFATDNNSCCYLYLIQDGRFYYFKLTDEMQQALKTGHEKAA